MQFKESISSGQEAAGFTGRYTAGLRFVESTCVANPLLPSDPLAGLLAGDRGLVLAKQELEQLIQAQGPGRHLRVPARSRLIDDLLELELARLRASHGAEDAAAAAAATTTITAATAARASSEYQPAADATGFSTRSGFVPAPGPGVEEPRPLPDPTAADTTADTRLGGTPRNGGAGAGTGAGPGASAATAGTLGDVPYQVVSLGAGMCTRPWRLAALAGCRVFELDLPHIARTKRKLLAAAGAQVTPAAGAQVTPAAGAQVTPAATGTAGGAGAATGVEAAAGSQAEAPAEDGAAEEPPAKQPRRCTEPPPTSQPHTALPSPQPPSLPPQTVAAFPLHAASYDLIGIDLSAAAGVEQLAAALTARGFDRSAPTVWVLEALLYYMPLAAASELLCGLGAISAPGSRLIATCVDQELLGASLRGVPKGHVFADLWHFDTEALLYDTEAFRTWWQVDWSQQPTEVSPSPEEQLTAVVPDAPGAEAASKDAGGADNTDADADSTRAASAGTAAVPAVSASAAAAAEPSAVRAPAPTSRPRLPASTRRWALERLGSETYIALYGGSELLFTAGLRDRPTSVPAATPPGVV